MEYYAPNLVLIAIDDYKQKDFSGRIYTKYSKEPLPFQSSMELIFELDDLYDKWNFPVNTVTYRGFYSNRGRKRKGAAAVQKKHYVTDELRGSIRLAALSKMLPIEHGKLATITLECQQRLHADWNGRFLIDGEKNDRYFNSTIEMLLAIDEYASEKVRKKVSLWDNAREM